MSKKTKEVITDDDLQFKHFKLAKKIAVHILEEMEKEGLYKEDLAQVLNDVCKVIVLNEAIVDKGGALTVVQRFVEMSGDVTRLMMRIIMGEVKAK